MFNFPGTVNLYSLDKNDISLTNLSSIEFKTPFLSFFIGEFSP